MKEANQAQLCVDKLTKAMEIDVPGHNKDECVVVPAGLDTQEQNWVV